MGAPVKSPSCTLYIRSLYAIQLNQTSALLRSSAEKLSVNTH